MKESAPALVIVDMQNYYLRADSPYSRYFDSFKAGCLDYIRNRCNSTVVPNIRLLLKHFRESSLPVVYLRLCGTKPDRSDLHPFFAETYRKALLAGFDGIYPLAKEPMASVIEEIAPIHGETVIDKTTFSAFTATDMDAHLRGLGVSELVFTGLATSQCVETTARDASERGYRVIHIEDAQADYDEMIHSYSLIASQGVCGGFITTAVNYSTGGISTGTREIG
ncbi:MAG: cysteine hydrolase [Spirochaetes bacterium]|nr:cysteine hydrolase [Spirochaetota bacterium]